MFNIYIEDLFVEPIHWSVRSERETEHAKRNEKETQREKLQDNKHKKKRPSTKKKRSNLVSLTDTY